MFVREVLTDVARQILKRMGSSVSHASDLRDYGFGEL